MILATDTHYGEQLTRTAGVLFCAWRDRAPRSTRVLTHPGRAADYRPGAFYLRELPFVLALLESLEARPSTVVIDGYVHLDDAGREGLGAHLYRALGRTVPVIGVAKRPFAGAAHAEKVYRGRGVNPLYVTAAGVPPSRAARAIRAMSGPHRLPDLLRLADRLSRRG